MRWFAILAGLVLTIAFGGPALAGHAWTALASLPDPDGAGFATGKTEGACAGVIGNKIYVAYGFDPGVGDTAFLRIYDIASNTWSLGPAAPAPVRSEGYRGVAHGGKLYCIGKRPVGAPDVVRFDPASGTWAVLSSMSDARAGTTAVVHGNAILVFGGRKSSVPAASAGLSRRARPRRSSATTSTRTRGPTRATSSRSAPTRRRRASATASTSSAAATDPRPS